MGARLEDVDPVKKVERVSGIRHCLFRRSIVYVVYSCIRQHASVNFHNAGSATINASVVVGALKTVGVRFGKTDVTAVGLVPQNPKEATTMCSIGPAFLNSHPAHASNTSPLQFPSASLCYSPRVHVRHDAPIRLVPALSEHDQLSQLRHAPRYPGNERSRTEPRA
jgi:hypothetical protein